VVSGLVFAVPIAVQPMKAVAALAIAGTMTSDQVPVAGIIVGLCVMILAFGAVAIAWMQAFPVTVLGVFLLPAGATLVQASRVWRTRNSLVVGTITLGIYLATGLLLAGFAAGWITHVFLSRATRGAPRRWRAYLSRPVFRRGSDDA